MSRLFRRIPENMYDVSDELDILIHSFRQRFELARDSEAAGFALYRLADDDTSDKEIDCVIRSYMRRLLPSPYPDLSEILMRLP